MATNTFSSLREPIFRIRPAASYTFRNVMIPGNRNYNLQAPYTHGTLAMSGWIRDSGGVSQQRVIYLKIFPANEVIARTVSDASNAGNNYFFNGLALLQDGESYTLEVHKEDVSTAPRIKDNRVPV